MDEEKFELLLAELHGMKNELQDVKNELQDVKNELQGIKQKVNRLDSGQAEIKRNLFRIERQISDTYNLALDAWGASEENKIFIESRKAMG